MNTFTVALLSLQNSLDNKELEDLKNENNDDCSDKSLDEETIPDEDFDKTKKKLQHSNSDYILYNHLNLRNFNSKLITPNDQKNEAKMLDIFLKDYQERYKSIISNLFYGTIQTKSQCSNCKTIKYNFQIFHIVLA